MSEPDEILDFWLGPSRPDGTIEPEKLARAWKKNPEFDREIERRFGELMQQAGRGELDSWADSPQGRVALVILLDQFSRNVHRGTAQAFAKDAKARSLVLDGIEKKEHEILEPMQAYFFLMPLMHAEDPALQERGVVLFTELAERAPSDVVRKTLNGAADFARRHRDIVVRFGRFPHRNELLGRESTDEEQEFLKQPGSSF